MKDYIWDYYRGYQGDTRSLDSYDLFSFEPCWQIII